MWKKILIVVFLLLLPAVSFVFSQTPAPTGVRLVTPTTTHVNWPPSPLGTNITPATQFHELIRYLYEWGIALGGIFVFIVIVKSGIEYLTSMGDPGKMSKSLESIKSAALGLILLLSSWLILNTINPQLTTLRPLPNLWGEFGNPPDIRHLDPGQNVAPCHFILVYPEIGFQGTPGVSPGVSPGVLRFDNDEQEVKRVAGAPAMNAITEPDWASVRPFTRLTEEEKNNRIEKRKINKKLPFSTYSDTGEPDPNGNYKEGGHCQLHVFRTTRRWFVSDNCGRRIARIQLPARDVSESFWQDEVITCVELVRAIPDLPTPAPAPASAE